MSSTKRGSKRSPADNYPTPSWVVHRLLETCPLPGGRWLEPGVGNGHIVRAALSGINGTDTRWANGVAFTGFDIRNTKFIKKDALIAPSLGEHFVGNLLKPEGRLAELLSGPKFDVSIGNPPFRLAAEFIDFSLKYAHHVAMLLRLNYLGSDKRAEFMRTLCPDVYVLPNRPSFRPSKRGLLTTDSIEYGWFVWGPETETTKGASLNTPYKASRYRTVGSIQVLSPTPKAVRRDR